MRWSWEGMAGVWESHTPTQRECRYAMLQLSCLIVPGCCLDLAYFNHWWLHTVKSELSWLCNTGISTGISLGAFCGSDQTMRLRPCPNVSRLLTPSLWYPSINVINNRKKCIFLCFFKTLMILKVVVLFRSSFLFFLVNVFQALAVHLNRLSL